jgi:hypothetical protein
MGRATFYGNDAVAELKLIRQQDRCPLGSVFHGIKKPWPN